jgi:hypothetical protein
MQVNRSPYRTLAACVLSLPAAPALAVGDLADVTVVDRATGRELPFYQRGGQWYVPGRPGSEYAIRNGTAADVLAVLSVDGVNAVSGETASPYQRGYVPGPGAWFDVAGWRKDPDRVAAFCFTRLEASHAARTGRPDHVGVIGVAVFRRLAEPPAAQLPPGEARPGALRDGPPAAPDPAKASAEARSQAKQRAGSAAPPDETLGTGHGRALDSPVRIARFEREPGPPAEVIVIRYDSRANLVALGVIPPERPRDPQPFPAGFVPDPPRR